MHERVELFQPSRSARVVKCTVTSFCFSPYPWLQGCMVDRLKRPTRATHRAPSPTVYPEFYLATPTRCNLPPHAPPLSIPKPHKAKPLSPATHRQLAHLLPSQLVSSPSLSPPSLLTPCSSVPSLSSPTRSPPSPPSPSPSPQPAFGVSQRLISPEAVLTRRGEQRCQHPRMDRPGAA